jgi:hypothetical protein
MNNKKSEETKSCVHGVRTIGYSYLPMNDEKVPVLSAKDLLG